MLKAANDELSIAGLSMVLQRIGLAHWSAEGVLRSWAAAPVHVAAGRVAVPCAADEAVWIGFWLDDNAESAAVTVTDKLSGRSASAHWPESYQLAALEGGSPKPIYRGTDRPSREFEVEVLVTARPGKAVRERFQLCLLEPRAWALESGRPEPPALKGPPPLPPRLP
jgi:hypothetical protein